METYTDSARVEQLVVQLTETIQEIAQTDCPSVGYFECLSVAGKKEKNWSISWGHEVQELFDLPTYRVAQVLAVLGSEVRLGILRELVREPLTAAELVQKLHMGTTGQAYHHLKDLQAAGYVNQREGRFHISMKVGRVYIAALALASNAGAKEDLS